MRCSTVGSDGVWQMDEMIGGLGRTAKVMYRAALELAIASTNAAHEATQARACRPLHLVLGVA